MERVCGEGWSYSWASSTERHANPNKRTTKNVSAILKTEERDVSVLCASLLDVQSLCECQ